MDTGKIRIKDIAERAGVSVGTVDRVLHKRPNVSKSALEKVEKALKEMDYKPNMYASALAYNKSYTFYCIIPKHESEAYWEEVEEGVLDACDRRSDFRVSQKMMYYNRFSTETFTKVTNECLKQKPHGVIIVPSKLDVTRKFTDQLHEQGIPFVLLDSYMVKSLSAMWEIQVQFLDWEEGNNNLEKKITTHSSILAWRIPWTEEPGGLQSTGLQRVRLLCSLIHTSYCQFVYFLLSPLFHLPSLLLLSPFLPSFLFYLPSLFKPFNSCVVITFGALNFHFWCAAVRGVTKSQTQLSN